MSDCVRIALPKGRMFEDMLELMKRCGYSFETSNSSRSLKLFSSCGQIESMIVRSQDVPTYVYYGAADLGVVGRDVLIEHEDMDENLFELLDLGFGRCRIVIAGLTNRKSLPSAVRVATKYPAIAKKIFQERGTSAEIIKLYGSVELAPLCNLADVIVDIVETGKTLEANGLEVIEECGISTARLIANRVAYKTRYELLNKFISGLENNL